MLIALIMAGGSGERFWALLTLTKRKQLISTDKIFIATNIL